MAVPPLVLVALSTLALFVASGCQGATITTGGGARSGADATVAGPGRIDEELAVRTLALDTYLVVHEPFFSANVLVAKMPDGTVVICSSPFETEASRALVAWIEAKLKPKRMVAINTHFHLDGTGGNEAYREHGVEIYASSLTQRLLTEKGASLRSESAKQFEGTERERMLAMKIVHAEHTFDERAGLALTFGGEQVRVVYPGAAHSPDNVVVFFPSRGVLFGGCMIKGSASVGFIGHADLENWESAVDVVRGLGARVVIPGHGPVGGPELFDLTSSVVRKARADKK
jgi:glyoxylase-like metal-dependent hydrolase (beta-lactamase superfamily II)